MYRFINASSHDRVIGWWGLTNLIGGVVLLLVICLATAIDRQDKEQKFYWAEAASRRLSGERLSVSAHKNRAIALQLMTTQLPYLAAALEQAKLAALVDLSLAKAKVRADETIVLNYYGPKP